MARDLLLCKSFCKVSVSAAEQQNLRRFVGDAAGGMPVCFLDKTKTKIYNFLGLDDIF